MDRKRQHCRAVTSLALLERARAWEWVKDPPAGEGQVEPSLAKEGRGGSKRTPSLAKEGRGGSKKNTIFKPKKRGILKKKPR